MASVSSLLKSAEATQRCIRQQQDAEVAYEWNRSAKTYEDFVSYSKYLEGQAEKTNDPSELLAYRKNIDSARSSYTSNEIQRQSIDVLEGRTTNTQKKDAMARLFFAAADEGNLDLAQSLRLQIDNLDLKIQAEADAAQVLASKLATLRAKSVDDAVDQLKGYGSELNELFKTKGTEGFTKEMAAYAQELGLEPGDFFGMHLRIAQEINSVLDSALASDTDPDNQRKFQKEKNDFNTKPSIALPAANGREMKVTYQDLVDQADAARTGQTIFRTLQTNEGTVFERNKETGFVWGRDENGEYRAITIYKPKTDYTSSTYKTKVDTKGNTIYLDSNGTEVAIRGKDGNLKGLNGKTIEDAVKRDYKELLQQNGFNVISSDGGYVEIANPKGNAVNGIPVDIPGTGSDTIRLFVNRDGKLQIVGEGNQLFNLDFDKNTGQFKGLLKDVPSPITLLNDNFSADFISKLNKTQLPPGAIGVVDKGLASSQLLRTAEFTRKDIANQAALDNLRRAQDEAATRERAQATQIIQPALDPQLAPKVNIQAPAISPQQALTVGGQRDLLGKTIDKVEVAKPQQSLQVQQPTRQPSLTVK